MMSVLYGAIYLGPTWLALYNRGGSRHPLWQVFLVNFLAGWTIVGWVFAWTMAMKLPTGLRFPADAP